MPGKKKRATGEVKKDPTSTPCYDVFISYSSKDSAWVRGELLPRIEQAGLKAFIDFRDFRRGAPSIKECERGVMDCTKTLAVLTPPYIRSGWTEIESIMTNTLDPGNRDLRLIPLLKRKCKKPLRVAALTHIDFTDGADLDLAWRQLLTALGAPPAQEPPRKPHRNDWFLAHPYPMPPNFTGRINERKMLTEWLADPLHPLLVLRALGGFGKSALAWHWLLYDTKPMAWPRVVWWSFYEGDSNFDHFLFDTLNYLSGGKIQAGQLSAKGTMKAIIDIVRQPGTLLILDGFERELRAFGGLNAPYQGDDAPRSETNERDCISPLAADFLRNIATLPEIRSKVLLTSRLLPRVLQVNGGGLLIGCREEQLKQMQPADAVEFFRVQGIRGTRGEVYNTCVPYGYHPLSLRLLAGWIVNDLQQPGDVAAAKRIDVTGDLKARQHHVLEQAYNSLAPKERRVLGCIACLRGSVKYDVLRSIIVETMEESPTDFDASLRGLISRGLLDRDAHQNRFDLHPIVRRYAYERLAGPDRPDVHIHLRRYFATLRKPEKITCLEDLAPLLELYHHTVRAGEWDDAFTVYRDWLATPLYFRLNAHRLIIELLSALFPDGEDHLPRLRNQIHQAYTLNELANSCSVTGRPHLAVSLYERHNAIQITLGNRSDLAIGLGNMASLAQIGIGKLRPAEANLRQRMTLFSQLQGRISEAIGQLELGRLLAYRGAFAASETELATAISVFEREEMTQWRGIGWAYRAIRELLMLRASVTSAVGDMPSIVDLARRSLGFADDSMDIDSPFSRDHVRAYWLLGAAHRSAGQFSEAEACLHEAMERCRGIDLIEMEGDILIDLARLRVDHGNATSAQRLAEEAIVITERCGYVLQGADAHLELAKLAFGRGDKDAGLEHAREAKRLATCDGPPDYTYKVAYDEACALLEKHGE